MKLTVVRTQFGTDATNGIMRRTRKRANGTVEDSDRLDTSVEHQGHD